MKSNFSISLALCHQDESLYTHLTLSGAKKLDTLINGAKVRCVFGQLVNPMCLYTASLEKIMFAKRVMSKGQLRSMTLYFQAHFFFFQFD